MKKTHYYIPEFYQQEFNKLIKSRQPFESIKTSYTKKLKSESYNIIFNPDGTGDDRVLSLINRVRKEGQQYLETGIKFPNTPIKFVDLFDIPKEREIICKVDITSAYWRKSLMDGIISYETDQLLKQYFAEEKTQRELKDIRLKVLGAMATRKEHEYFDDGKSQDYEIIEQPTKPLYMNICRCIDDIMRRCRLDVDGCVFYYWDCMFVRKEYSRDVVDFFARKNFNCKMEETRLEFHTIGTKSYFTSEVDGKMYMVESRNRKLLSQYDSNTVSE